MSIRARLTLWYAGALAAVLLAYAGGVYAFLEHRLSATLDDQLHDDYEFAEQMLEKTPEGGVRWRRPETEGPCAEVRDAAGKLLYQGPAPRPEGRLRTWGKPYTIEGIPVEIKVFKSEELLRRELRELTLVLGLGLPLGVGLAALVGALLAKRALAPVDAMAERARAITAERLGERLPPGNPSDELGRLAAAFNETFARLERSFEQMRRFTADASHELRTPLTAMRSVGEVALRTPRDPDAYREAIGSMLEEVERLTRLVESLLTLSRADGGALRLNLEEVDLSVLAREVAAQLAVLAEEKRQTVAVEAPAPVPAKADRLVLRQALANLLDNAIKHGPEGSTIRLVVGPGPVMEVADQGPGIPPEHRERIFERFYRVDQARSREGGGVGLGLAIARWAVEAHGGKIEVESRVDQGSLFRIRLP